MKSVLMATTEFTPFAKSGGLGDVLGALPFALRKEGVDARVVMPFYTFLPEKILKSAKLVKETHVVLGWRKLYCGILEADYNGLPMYFIDSKDYFGGDKLYYKMEDDIERFAFYCMSVLNALPHIDFKPDVIHCHDWHTSMIPVLYHAHFKKVRFFSSIKTVFTIHNLKYQGICNKYKLYDVLGINDSYSVSPSLSYGYDLANCLKGGLSIADKLTTVSETYAREIRNPYYGEGLNALLEWRGHDLAGIVNGIDTDAYDPSSDGAIAQTYTAESAVQGKAINKAALLKQLKLEADENVPVIAMVTRLVEQKGIDLIKHVFDEIADDAVFVLLGTGDTHYENFFSWKQTQYPKTVAACIAFDDTLARRIYAGADLFLMPSLFEPCGIGQMLAMRYGALPIVRETGGLVDTVRSYNEATGEGNGYSFHDINAHDMLHTIKRAAGYYRNARSLHNKLVASAMACDYSWGKSARRYKELYDYL